MRLEVSIKEFQELINDHYHINIDFKNIEANKIKAAYVDSIVLKIKEVKNDEILFDYEADGFVELIAKVASLFLKRKLDNLPIGWDSRTRELTIDLKKIKRLRELLEFVYISELQIVNDNILLILYERDKT